MPRTDTPPAGIALLRDYLDSQHVRHEVFEHAASHSAYQEALAASAPPSHTAKTIVLHGAGGYALVVIPASHRLELRKVRSAMHAGPDLRFAAEDEIARDLGGYEPGSVPPVGPGLPPLEVFDRRLLDHRWILCNGGDETHSVRLDPMDVLRISSPRVVDACED